MVVHLARDLAAVLAAEVRGLPSGARLDSEHVIMKRFSVSRSTVRAALRDLSDQHLIRRVQGSGTYVNRRIDYVLARGRSWSLDEAVAAAGAETRTRLVEGDQRPIPTDPARRLGLAPGTTGQRLVQLSHIDDEVSACSEDWLAPDVVAHVDVGLRVSDSLGHLLRGGGYDPIRAWSRVFIDVPPQSVLHRLELDHAQSTWVVQSVTRDGVGRALVSGTTWIRADRVRVALELDDP